MCDGDIQPHHLSGEPAPGASAVHDHIKIQNVSFVRLDACGFSPLGDNLGHRCADDCFPTVCLHLSDKGVGDHGPVKVAVILGVAGAQDFVRTPASEIDTTACAMIRNNIGD